jgi:uncharacterized protein YjbI with pentapeptide repeats
MTNWPPSKFALPKIAEQARASELEIAQDNQREAALQDYFDEMTQLLLEKELRHSEPTSEVRTLARSRTLTTLRNLDGERKGFLVQFLHEAGLVYTNTAVVSLAGADLSEAKFGGADLRGANLSDTFLWEADLSKVTLHGADLSKAFLEGADLAGAKYTPATIWPSGFDPQAHGAVLVE